MSRKDFVLIAEALKATKPINKGMPALDAWYETIRSVANALRSTNSLFDKDRFLAACEPK